MESLTIRGYAKYKGVDHKSVIKAIDTGKIERALYKDEKGVQMLKVSVADREWAMNSNPALARAESVIKDIQVLESGGVVVIDEKKLAQQKKKAKIETVLEEEATEILEDDDDIKLKNQTQIDFEEEEDSKSIDYNSPIQPRATLAEITRREKFYKTQLLEFEMKTKQGLLVSKEDVYKQLYNIAKEIRSSFEAVPDAIVDHVMAATSRAEGYKIISEEITRALERISKIEIENSAGI